MINERDPLEAELEAMKPQEVSFDLRRRINRQLHWQQRGKVFAFAGLATAACVALAVLLHNMPRKPLDPDPVALVPAPTPKAPPQQTLYAYHRALLESDEKFDELLERHAAMPRAKEPYPRGRPRLDQDLLD